MLFLWHCLLDGGDFPAGLFLVAAAVVVLIAFANDDDLPGPRRCFARMSGPRPSALGVES